MHYRGFSKLRKCAFPHTNVARDKIADHAFPAETKQVGVVFVWFFQNTFLRFYPHPLRLFYNPPQLFYREVGHLVLGYKICERRQERKDRKKERKETKKEGRKVRKKGKKWWVPGASSEVRLPLSCCPVPYYLKLLERAAFFFSLPKAVAGNKDAFAASASKLSVKSCVLLKIAPFPRRRKHERRVSTVDVPPKR